MADGSEQFRIIQQAIEEAADLMENERCASEAERKSVRQERNKRLSALTSLMAENHRLRNRIDALVSALPEAERRDWLS